MVRSFGGTSRKRLDSLASKDRSDLTIRTLERWLSPPAAFEVWSGVREAPYTLDTNIEFVRRPSVATGPFEFVLQASFTSEPEFGDTGTTTFFELTSVQGKIHELISAAVARRRDAADAVARMQDFALLQRFFRAALEGRLGREFPLEKLSALTRATAGVVTAAKTPRWNVRPGHLEQAIERVATLGLADSDVSREPSIAAALKTCVAIVEPSRRAASPIDGLAGRCSFEPEIKALAATCDTGGDQVPCRRLQVLRTIAELAQGIELRRLLGVSAEDERLRLGAVCVTGN